MLRTAITATWQPYYSKYEGKYSFVEKEVYAIVETLHK